MPSNSSSGSSPYDIGSAWLAPLNDAIKQNDMDAFAACFVPNGWLKDAFVFSLGSTSHHGFEAICEYLKDTLAQAEISNITLDNHEHGRPFISEILPGVPCVEAALDFTTAKAVCKGYAWILYPAAPDALPKASLLTLRVENWKGHEEVTHDTSIVDGHIVSWQEKTEKRRAEIESDPDVLVVGAGQCGLQAAASLQQQGFKTLVIEQTLRVGDAWRNRYPTLILHTPRTHHCFAYQPFPTNWPKYSPRDKIADWLEQYAKMQDLVIWTSSTLSASPTPRYNKDSEWWDVAVLRNGTSITLHPKHIVVAIGRGDPIIPKSSGIDSFRGRMLHSSAFKGGGAFAGQRVLVVGAGNSGADICQDLVVRGAAEVTMLQRSPTYVISMSLLEMILDSAYKEDRPGEYNDLASSNLDLAILRERESLTRLFTDAVDKEFLDALEAKGFRVCKDLSRGGVATHSFAYGGHYIIDVGWGKLVLQDKVKIRHGEISHATENAVVLSDSTSLEVDAIVLATGWGPITEKLRRTFASETIDRLEDFRKLDQHSEYSGVFKPSGHGGFWLLEGEFSAARVLSKQLALFIKAIELGYIPRS